MNADSTRFCIICGQEFKTDSPDAAVCPACGGPEEAAASPGEQAAGSGAPARDQAGRGTLRMPDGDFDPAGTRRMPPPGDSHGEGTRRMPDPEESEPGAGTRRMPPPDERPEPPPDREPAQPSPEPPPSPPPQPTSILKTGQTIFGLYEIRSILGAGGMGTVYRAHHNTWQIDLALKVPHIKEDDPDLQKEFVKEAEAWIDLGLHPNTVSCFYVRRLEEHLLVFAECIEGGSLGDHIKRSKDRSVRHLLDLAIQFAWGLDFAHQKGLVHNDVKPGNVLVAADGTLKVTDFGLAGSVGRLTAEYASPELTLRQPTTPQSDIWSWALAVLFMFNGERTWGDGTIAKGILEDYLEMGATVPGSPEMPSGLVDLLHECFQEDPGRRPREMADVSTRLIEIYRKTVGRRYPREVPEPADLRADSLNNKALSLLDLGHTEEAVALWEQSLEEDPAHTAANLNLAAWRWHAAEITDDEMFYGLNQVEGQNPDDAIRWFGLGCFQAERGEAEKADEAFGKASRIDPRFSPPDVPGGLTARPVLEGHSEAIYALARTPEGLLASGSSDGTIRIWDLDTGRCTRTFKKAGFTTSIAFSPDGRWMASGSGDRTARLWDVRRGKMVRQLSGHGDVVTSVGFSKDGEIIVSGSLDGTARLWERGSGDSVGEYRGHSHWVLSLQVLHDEDLVLTASRDQTLRLWNLYSHETVQVYKRPRSPRKAEYGSGSYASGRVLWAGYDKMCLWDFDRGELLHTFRSCEDTTAVDPFVDGDISPDGRLAVSVGRDGELRLWDTETSRCIRTLPAQGGSWRGMFIDSSTIASGRGTRIHRWDVDLDPAARVYHPVLSLPESGSEALEKQQALASCLEKADEHLAKNRPKRAEAVLRKFQQEPGFGHNNALLEKLAVAGRQGRLATLREWWRRGTFKLGEWEGLGGVCGMRFSPDGRKLAAGSAEGSVGIYDIKKNAVGAEMGRSIGHVISFVFLEEDSLLSLSKNGDVVLWDLAAEKGRRVDTGMDPEEGAHLSAILAEDGRYMAVLGMKGYSLRQLDLTRTEPMVFTEYHPQVIRSKIDIGMPAVMDGDHAGYDYRAAVSPDSRFYSTSIMNTKFGRSAHPVYIWEVQHQGIRLAHTLTGHKAPVLSMAFSPDGSLLASADIAGFLRLWRTSSGRISEEIHMKDCRFTAAAFSADSRRVMAGDEEGSLHLWWTDGRRITSSEAHAGAVNVLAFSDDDRFAASGGYDNTVQLWEFDWEFEF